MICRRIAYVMPPLSRLNLFPVLTAGIFLLANSAPAAITDVGLHQLGEAGSCGVSNSTIGNGVTRLGRFAVQRHDKAINIGYLDGYRRWVKVMDLKQFAWSLDPAWP